MDTTEFPLVLFTIATQMAVGAFVVLGAVQLFIARQYGRAAVETLTRPAGYAVGVVMVLGLVASILHLGSPQRALNSLRHLGTSPLSNEIALGLAFAAAGFAFAVLEWRRIGTSRVRQALAGGTAVIGLAFVWASARIYQLPAQPAWNTWYTPASFFATALLLGTLAIGTAFVIAAARRLQADRNDPIAGLLRTCLRWVATGSIAMLGVELVIIPIYAVQLGAQPAVGAPFILRLVLLVLGAGILGLALYWAASTERAGTLSLAAITTAALALVLVGEGIGRLLFYGLAQSGIGS